MGKSKARKLVENLRATLIPNAMPEGFMDAGNDAKALVKAALRIAEREYPAIYSFMNGTKPRVLYDAAHKVMARAQTTDMDALARALIEYFTKSGSYR